jgi:hypothetical protein
MAGPAWLATRGDDPHVAAFTALQAFSAPPAPADIDEITSRLLRARAVTTRGKAEVAAGNRGRQPRGQRPLTSRPVQQEPQEAAEGR